MRRTERGPKSFLEKTARGKKADKLADVEDRGSVPNAAALSVSLPWAAWVGAWRGAGGVHIGQIERGCRQVLSSPTAFTGRSQSAVAPALLGTDQTQPQGVLGSSPAM